MQEGNLKEMRIEAIEMNQKIDVVKKFIADMDLNKLKLFEAILEEKRPVDTILEEQLKVVKAKIKELTSVKQVDEVTE
ncbi:MAG: hypothetical protein COZ34_02300 [Candidatus Pacebacteria bacterium CG_4_10_14_3_um_filter_34_15]|nr:hypothetical protein [Candidatus Paceibacterota bacterium]OIO44587.1 MAG: hypothetical protein AUJ41_02430 [Candidatus Pacebacteria bacterium CG1_02_43_31]PIQ80699.1 MAG: hypothetical protein COV78_04110 [Candidatus Pacebacteria bacterium CG11_big_fil_rev_8_21_14_0_20_34_55]PIX81628.1 MAG: hypothetical protein COZ34_02300 [Candidatus Pacebacteria bacterium CG_4_10_14_3_um_filter_34_15]PJC43557.1 MAG: hypothetical protein CO039_03450 [Candidatus Pacebacteria bacterium CG_4_9_14_0_2_um_filter_